jgi:uncharacterized protein YgiM (DUF1202 family)
MLRSCLFIFSLTLTLNASPIKNSSGKKIPEKKETSFQAFTGKIVANKVRLRVKPDLESQILRQMNKNELLLVVGEDKDFYSVEPPKNTKAYVFRSYILDNVVEASRVNIRLEPHPDAPIIGQLDIGDKVNGQICPINHKWLEIPAPKQTHFYISKEFVTYAGATDYLATMDRRKTQVEELLNSGFLLADAECKKSYQDMSPSQAIHKFETVLSNFSDFPEAIGQAKEALTLLKETYLNKKIAYLEAKEELTSSAKEELITKHKEENSKLFVNAPINSNPHLWKKRAQKKESTDSSNPWNAIEESLFLSWTAFHSGKKLEDFYSEQMANASVLYGTVEEYKAEIQDRPGDFLLRNQSSPEAYLYSTQVDLSQYVGQKVKLIASQRPNNHFAFPAYFVFVID